MADETRTRVLLLRHAAPAAPHLLHGAASDIGLRERGRQQAEAIGPILAMERPVVVISSAMRRAVETDEPISRACGVELLVEPDLHERRIGGLCGRPYKAGEIGFSTERAESFDSVRCRVMQVWRDLACRFDGETYVVVAQGA
ncbi:MAG: histidine phosphatase family protein [Isosphaeraceae bacterium]